MLISERIEIPDSELEFSFVRSSGPGGQNVNKVNSKAVLRWNIVDSESLSPEAKSLILQKLSSQITRSGDLLITSDRFRDQFRNREDCLEKFRALLSSALAPAKKRKKTKPSRSSQIRAKHKKARHSEKKRQRRFSTED